MGYTHYWERSIADEPKEAFGRFAMDALAIIAKAKEIGIDLADWDGNGQPTVNEGEVRLNGRNGVASWGKLEAYVGAADATEPSPDGSHETFAWPAKAEVKEWQRAELFEEGQAFDFCKTARKPYDAVVCALLIAAKDHYGASLRVSSDGTWGGSGYEHVRWVEWLAGRELYELALGRVATNAATICEEVPW